jgi:phosphatidylcholine synthase
MSQPRSERSAWARCSPRRGLAGWCVHALTASGAVLGVVALAQAHRGELVAAFWLLAAAMVVDAVDGTLARRARVTESAAGIDGALLDNLVDYLNYTVVPAFMLATAGLLPAGTGLAGAGLVVWVSALQFSQRDAKTSDHFFKGFPSCWNIVVFYFFVWNSPPLFNLAAVCALAGLVFVPIKYIYPSRMQHLSASRALRATALAATGLWGLASAGLLWLYPRPNLALSAYCAACIAAYFAASIYRTIVPLRAAVSDARV